MWNIIDIICNFFRYQSINTNIETTANIFVIAGTFFAGFQYLKQKQLTKVSNAVKLAEYFANEVIEPACLLYCNFSIQTEVKGFVESHKEEIMRYKIFNKQIYKEFFSPNERQKYEEFLKQPVSKNTSKKNGILMQETLNQLEHMAISFNTGLADEKVVYQSLHQVFFELFDCAYPCICFFNENNADSYYTNLCKMYLRWNKIRAKAVKKEERKKKRLEKKLAKIHNAAKYSKAGIMSPGKI